MTQGQFAHALRRAAYANITQQEVSNWMRHRGRRMYPQAFAKIGQVLRLSEAEVLELARLWIYER